MQMEVGFHPGGERLLGGFHGPGVFEPGVPQHGIIKLLGKPFARRCGRRPVSAAFPQGAVHVERPELMREPHARQNVQNQVGKDYVQVKAEFRTAGRIDLGRKLVLSRGPFGHRLAKPIGHRRGRARLVVGVAVHNAGAVRAVEAHLGQVTHGVILARKRVRVGLAVDYVHMIALGEGVQGDFPVTSNLGLIGVARGQVGIRKAAHAPAQLAQIGFQRLRRLGVHMDKQKSLPHGGRHRHQTVGGFVEVVKKRFVRHPDQLAVRIIHPAVEFTRKVPTVAPLLPGQLIAAMRTDIVKAPDGAVLSADKNHRSPAGFEIPHHIIAGTGDFFLTTHVQPDFAEHPFALQLKIGRRNTGFGWHRLGSQLGILFRPAFIDIKDSGCHLPPLCGRRLYFSLHHGHDFFGEQILGS